MWDATFSTKQPRDLGGPWLARPRAEWLIVPGAFKGIVDPKTFAVAQEILSHQTARKTDEQVLRELRSLLDSKGKLNPKIIDSAQVWRVRARYGADLVASARHMN
jgi:hypothetical protein